MTRWIVRTLLLLALAGVVVGAAAWYSDRNRDAQSAYRTTAVKQGDILATISATGTLEPEELVDVGAQVAGQILEFGKDASGKPIDYRSEVEQDMVLAKIDDTVYKADLASQTAQLEEAKASVIRAQADLGQMQAKLVQAQRDWERAEKLGPSEALAETAYDQYKAAYDTAKAVVGVGEAAIKQAQAVVAQFEAAVDRAKRNLSYCTITSPVKGEIIDRRVNIGQTVVASLNAPSLFLIAKDLKRMQVWVAVNEADIGQIHPGQPVTFSVDAFPGQTFKGEVGKVRLNAAMTQNVVNYTVEVLTDNSSGKLLPYLTANVSFQVGRRENVLLVPNAALRFTPRSAPASTESSPAERRARASTRPAAPEEGTARGTVWVQDGTSVKPIRVRTGLTDGAMTEVISDQLTEGSEVIVGEPRGGSDSGLGAGGGAGTSGPTNPFAPQFPRGGRRGM
jgi:HlyD family secretion protein